MGANGDVGATEARFGLTGLPEDLAAAAIEPLRAAAAAANAAEVAAAPSL